MMAKANAKYGMSTKVRGISVVHNDPDAPWPTPRQLVLPALVECRRSVVTVLQTSSTVHTERPHQPLRWRTRVDNSKPRRTCGTRATMRHMSQADRDTLETRRLDHLFEEIEAERKGIKRTRRLAAA